MPVIPPNETIAKRIRMAVVGQSNEFGSGPFRHRSHYGAPYADPLNTIDGSWWPIALDKLWKETNIWCDIANTAVGATGIIKEWCGDSVGDGSGTPFSSGDVGWDPNGYQVAALAASLDSAATHQSWVYISLGQADAGDSISLTNFQLGLQNTINYFLANDVKIMLGFTCYLASEATWFADTGSIAVANILANYSGSSVVKAGADLYTELGADIDFLPDATHMTERSYILSGNVVGTAMINALQ